MEVATHYGDSDLLATIDNVTRDFRTDERDTKRKIIKNMLTLRHNMKYNKHLVSVYEKAKALFDTMVEEHRGQIQALDEIHRHINEVIRKELGYSNKTNQQSEIYKDKKRIGALLKRMRASLEHMMNVDTVIGVTIDNINNITFMDEHIENNDDDDGDDDAGDDGDDGDEEMEDDDNDEDTDDTNEDTDDTDEDTEDDDEDDAEVDDDEETEDDDAEDDADDSDDSEETEDDL
jgi:hypothetical protein